MEIKIMLSSPIDMVLVGMAALLLFGPKRLPELGKSLGQGLGNFKKALTDAADGVANDNQKAKSNNDPELTSRPTAMLDSNPELAPKPASDNDKSE